MKKIITATVMVGFTALMLSAVFSSFAMAAVAGDIPDLAAPDTVVTDKASFLKTVTTIINWIFTIFVVFAIIFVILAAFQFITGGGYSKNVESARNKLMWAAVGVIVALLARGLPFVIASLLGATIKAQ